MPQDMNYHHMVAVERDLHSLVIEQERTNSLLEETIKILLQIKHNQPNTMDVS